MVLGLLEWATISFDGLVVVLIVFLFFGGFLWFALTMISMGLTFVCGWVSPSPIYFAWVMGIIVVLMTLWFMATAWMIEGVPTMVPVLIDITCLIVGFQLLIGAFAYADEY